MKVLILGYFDNNIGDDLMIMTIVNRFKDIDFYAHNSNTLISKTFDNTDNFTILNEPLDKNNLCTYDACLKIGGSLFMIESKSHIIQRIREISFAKRLYKNKVPSAVLGSNLGPFKQPFAKYLIKKELSYKQLITVRDQSSYNQIQDFNLKKSRVGIFDDIVYNYPVDKKENDSLILGISVYNSAKIADKLNYLKNKAKVCEHFIQQGYKVKLFSFDSEHENDLVNCNHIKNFIKTEYREQVQIIPYLGDYNEFLSEFSSCTTIIATRFHSAILSDMYGIPYYPIAYSNKMINFLNDNQYAGDVLTLDQFVNQHDDEKLFEFFNNPKNLNESKKDNNAFKHLEYISDFFREVEGYEK